MKKLLILAVFCLLAFSTDAVAQFVNTNTTKQKAYTKESQTSTATTTNKAYIKEPKTNTASNKSNSYIDGHLNTGVIFNDAGAGPILEIMLGGTFFEHLYLAGYWGLHTHFEGVPEYLQSYTGKKVFTSLYMPFGANMKIFFTKRSKHIVPFIESTFGYFTGLGGEIEGRNGFFCQAGMGVDIGMLSLSIGYNGLVKGSAANFGYIKIGFTPGR